MDNQGARYQDLYQRINVRFRERQIVGAQMDWRDLTAKGVLVETRPYFLIKKGLVSLALNVGEFGKDLFISMATYIKPPISNFRVMLLGGAILFALAGGPIMLGMLSSAANSITSSFSPFGGGNGSNSFTSSLILISCLLGPLWTLDWIALQIGLVYSAYKWLKEKDFLALLRVPPNEFNEDDLMALEKAVEQTIRASLDDIGLNPAELRPAAIQGNEQRLI